MDFLEATEQTPPSDCSPPPSYDDAVTDVPPDYASSESLAHRKPLCDSALPPVYLRRTPQPYEPRALSGLMSSSIIDFDDTSNFQSHGGAKKKKQAAKAANQAKWAGSGDEGNKEGENGEGNDGGEGGGGSNNGNGGAGDDGGDDWDLGGGGGKKNKKGRKGKNTVDDEDEKKKKEEEERKKKEEEEEEEEAAAAANGGGSLSWADGGDANPDDEWSGFTTAKKGKKNKKGKVHSFTIV